jgi:hypothetical protein
MKWFLLQFLIWLIPTANVFSQSFDWAIRDGGWSLVNNARSVYADAEGNVYLSGYYDHYLAGYPEGAFTAKYNSGGVQEWINKSELTDISFRVVGQDADGDFYITGYSTGFTVSIGSVTINNPTGSGPFIARLDFVSESLDGCLWAKALDFPVQSYCLDKPSGSLYLSGTYNEPISVDSFSLPGNQGYAYDGYIAKFKNDGSCEWMRRAGDRGAGFITVNSAGSISIAGELFGTATFGTDTDSVTLHGAGTNEEIFIAQFNNAGALVYAKKVGPQSDGSIFLSGIQFDNLNNVYAVGKIYGNYDFEGTIAAGQNGGAFTAKYGAAGNLEWIKTINSSGPAAASCSDIEVLNSENIYITGVVGDTAVFEDSVLMNHDNSMNMFIIKYNSDGDIVWRENGRSQAGSHPSRSIGKTLSAHDGSVWVAGDFANAIQLGDSIFQTAPSGPEDVFICKLHDNTYSPDGIVNNSVNELTFQIHPNPASTVVHISSGSGAETGGVVRIYNVLGELIHCCQIQEVDMVVDVSRFGRGLYIVELISDHDRASKKLVVD